MIEAFIKGFALGLLLVFSVGPVIFTIIKQSINHGKRGGFSFVAGVWFSDVIWVVLSNGFSEIIKSLLNFKVPIGIAGSLFLIAMGIYFAFIKKIEGKKQQEAIEIEGDEENVNTFIDWCYVGSPLSKVIEVISEEQPVRDLQTFELKR